MKKLVVLGSTGSIGINTLEVVNEHPDRFEVFGLANHGNIELLLKQIEKYSPRFAVVEDEDAYNNLKNRISENITLLQGSEGLKTLICEQADNYDVLVNAMVGFSGLLPTYFALECSKEICIANKEAIVVGGELFKNMFGESFSKIVPIDSEHSGLLFLLFNRNNKDVRKVILTASGGPFRTISTANLAHVTVNEALEHPTWSMGKKITIDSATLMNKGFEVIEAHHLFDIEYKNIDVIIHKESIIHAMVETIDGEIYAQLGPKDMRFPIQNALTYPELLSNSFEKLDLLKIKTLSFDEPDIKKFPLLSKAYEVGLAGGTFPAVLNASNEVAVNAFVNGQIGFIDIYNVVDEALSSHHTVSQPQLEDIIDVDRETRVFCNDFIDDRLN